MHNFLHAHSHEAAIASWLLRKVVGKEAETRDGDRAAPGNGGRDEKHVGWEHVPRFCRLDISRTVDLVEEGKVAHAEGSSRTSGSDPAIEGI